jgi:hypothetical protein
MVEHTHRLNSSLSDANFKLSCENVLSKIVRPDQSTIDMILSYDDPQKAEIILPDGQKFAWYFAIGSMINPISLHLRDLTPIISYPAKCLDYQLLFRGVSSMGGMADIEACPGAEFHGVVHLLSEEQMARLDAMEMTYNRIAVNSINYQGQLHLVSAYKMGLQNLQPNIPSERYLDIIVKGCEYFKVEPEYVARLKEKQPVIPRKPPHKFQSLTDVPEDVFYSVEELARHNGSDPSLPIWVCVNGKILEHVADVAEDDDHPDAEARKRLLGFIKMRIAGRDATEITSRVLYEPLYPLPVDGQPICAEHQAQIEDDLCSRIGYNQNQKHWKPIGRLRPIHNSS